MSALPYYAAIASCNAPFTIHSLGRKIGKVFGPSKILRTTDNIGAEGAFEDGAKLVGAVSHVELYKIMHVQEWAPNLAAQLDPAISERSRAFQLRAAACICAILGIDGKSPVDEVLIWLDPKEVTAQHWAQKAAVQYQIPLHDLADPVVFETWRSWADQHTRNMTVAQS